MKLGTFFRTHNKRLNGRTLPVLSLLILLSLLLVACSQAATPTEAPASPTDPPAQPTEAPAPPEAMREGIFRVAMQPLVQTDPAFISSDSEVLVANHVYDYLIDIDPDSNVVPSLATGWTISDDGLTYVFTLASDVTFHDGSSFSAEDVVWTYNRLRDPALELPTAGLYENISDIQATGDLEVTFTLNNPNPFFLYDLSDNHALMLKAGTADADTNFNGTGPFKVTNYSPEDRIELEANEAYFVEGEPKLAILEIIFFNDENASVDALRSGQVDLVMRMSTPLFESLSGEPNITTIDIPTNGFDLIRLRSDRPPGDNPMVI